MKPSQAMYDAAAGRYVVDSISGNPMIVRNVVDTVFPLIRQDALEEFLEGSGTRHTGLERQIREDQVKRIVNIIANLQSKTASTGVGPWNAGYEAAIDDILLALKL